MSTFRQLLSVNAYVGIALIFGLVNNLAIAAIFGLSRPLDAYFAGSMLINLFMVLVIDFLGKNFLPIYASRYEVSRVSASDLTSSVVNIIGSVAFLISVLLLTLSEYLFSLILPGFVESDIKIVVYYFTIMSPCIVIMTVNTFHAYVWQHNENYNRVVIARLSSPITLTVFIFAFGANIGTKALPFGYLCGQLIAGVILAYGIPYKYRLKLNFKDRDFAKIVRNSGLLMSTGFIARSKSIIVQYFASQIGEGAISAISLAQKISQPIYQNVLAGIQMILFSRSAKAVARENLQSFARMHNQAFKGVFLLAAPIAIWFLIEGELIVRALFQRGAFTDGMVNDVYASLAGMAGSIVFLGAVQMGSNAFYALDRVIVPAVLMPLSTLLFLALAAYFTPNFGLFGLTATTSVVSAITLTILFWELRKSVSALAVVEISIALAKYLFASVIAAWSAHIVTTELNYPIFSRFIISMIIVGATYLLLVWLSGDKFIRDIVKLSGLQSWLKRRSGN